MSLYGDVYAALSAANVRFVVVGGQAVVLQGHARLTVDLDLVVDLEPAAARRGVEALAALGLRPRVPVAAIDFADPAIRRSWIEQKNMQVFSLFDPMDARRVVDLFVEPPTSFDELVNRSTTLLLDGTSVRVASVEDLIAMKSDTGRSKDTEDVAVLRGLL